MWFPMPGTYVTKYPSFNVYNNLFNDFTFISLPNDKNENYKYSIIIGTGLSQTPWTPTIFLHPIWLSRYVSFAKFLFYFCRNVLAFLWQLSHCKYLFLQLETNLVLKTNTICFSKSKLNCIVQSSSFLV